MKQVLSQQEIDSLLNALNTGEINPEEMKQEEEKNNEGKVSTEYVAPKQDVQNISVEVTPEMYLLAGVSVLVLITASVLVSGIVILKRNPKDILSEMS